jgi:hypothetical protein
MRSQEIQCLQVARAGGRRQPAGQGFVRQPQTAVRVCGCRPWKFVLLGQDRVQRCSSTKILARLESGLQLARTRRIPESWVQMARPGRRCPLLPMQPVRCIDIYLQSNLGLWHLQPLYPFGASIFTTLLVSTTSIWLMGYTAAKSKLPTQIKIRRFTQLPAVPCVYLQPRDWTA